MCIRDRADLDPVAHKHRPAEQEGASGKGGVDDVLAQAAEKHLHQDDCKEVAQNDRPVRNGDRADEGQQHAGNDGGQVIGLAVQLPDLAEDVYKRQLKDGAVTETDCCYGSCVYQSNCIIAKEIDQLQEQ